MTDPHNIPSSTLARAVAAGNHAATYGFDWANAADALEKVPEEAHELAEAIEGSPAAHVREELGDLLFAVCNVARKLQIDPDLALLDATEKFERRFKSLLEAVRQSGREPDQMSLDELEQVWVDIKRPR